MDLEAAIEDAQEAGERGEAEVAAEVEADRGGGGGHVPQSINAFELITMCGGLDSRPPQPLAALALTHALALALTLIPILPHALTLTLTPT